MNKGADCAFVMPSSRYWTIASWMFLQKNQAGMGWRKSDTNSLELDIIQSSRIIKSIT